MAYTLRLGSFGSAADVHGGRCDTVALMRGCDALAMQGASVYDARCRGGINFADEIVKNPPPTESSTRRHEM